MSCLKPFTTISSKTSHFNWILSIVLKFKSLSLLYTPGLSAWMASVVSQSQYGVKPYIVKKSSFHRLSTQQALIRNESK